MNWDLVNCENANFEYAFRMRGHPFARWCEHVVVRSRDSVNRIPNVRSAEYLVLHVPFFQSNDNWW